MNGPTPQTNRRGPRPNRPVALIAGAAGFLGSHLATRLIDDGWRVYGVDDFHTGLARNLAHLADHPDFVFMEHDIRRPLPKIAGLAQVWNLACPASPPHYQDQPIRTATTSVVGTLNLLELATQAEARFVMTSTSEIYGDPEVHPQPESYRGCVNTTGPRACYDEGKRMAEALCYDFVRQYGTDVRVARVFNTYGPRMRLDDGRIVSNFVAQALTGQKLTIYGSGRQTRSFCYVDDLVEGLVRLIEVERRPETPVNLGNPEEYSILEMAEMIGRLTGRRIRTTHDPLPADDPRRRRPDIALARRLLDWEPRVPLRTGLAATIDWFAELLAEEGRLVAKPAAELRGAAARRREPAGGAAVSLGLAAPEH
ncbi:UDP-glucuronic acid decarboxylase family protein [Tistrella mobilis]|uniref:UDP-glucuronate decarboxylase n=1 Tax=Tistrella mobilis (strain KA081020-065) TaxID=1110502 RepID=I3TSI4_TISMK|nr:UDP-glucuronic acid decarboxylase family protein [Tistrella mobilis]AFK55722.1 NAD-dependent epimerase/dehydratase [Tistrella mobilis KA081020-065]